MIYTVIEAVSYGDPALIDISCHYVLQEIPSNEHKSLEFIVTLLEYFSVVSPLVAITYTCSQRGIHKKNSNGSNLP